MAKKVGLGRGLDALYDTSVADMMNGDSENNIANIRLSLIEPKSEQPRKDFNKESLAELADSILTHGVIQPIAVRKLENGYYQIIAGERRWRASKMAGLNEIPAIIHDVDDYTAAKMTMVENLQREDLNPVEEAMGYKFLSETYELTQEEIAKQVAKSRSVIANSMRILSLPREILDMLGQGKLSLGHAKPLLALDSEEEQIAIAEKIVKNDLSVRDVEKYVRDKKNQENDKNETPRHTNESLYIKSIQQKMSRIMGTPINIAQKSGKSSGKLEIVYKDNDQLESLIRTLCGDEAFED